MTVARYRKKPPAPAANQISGIPRIPPVRHTQPVPVVYVDTCVTRTYIHITYVMCTHAHACIQSCMVTRG